MFNPYMFFDPTIIILLPAIILASVAQMKVSTTFNKYSRINNKKGITGAEVAMQLLERNGVYDVQVEAVQGKLTDHYDPINKKVRLSKDNYSSTSISALSVAAHEVGHAIQHQEGYIPLQIRSASFPIVNFSSKLSWPLITIGLFIGFFGIGSLILLKIGIILFTAVVFFQLITLPVEFNASKRANDMLENYNFLDGSEIQGSKKVLNAAALTYVAAASSGILQLIRLLLILNNRDNRS